MAGKPLVFSAQITAADKQPLRQNVERGEDVVANKLDSAYDKGTDALSGIKGTNVGSGKDKLTQGGGVKDVHNSASDSPKEMREAFNPVHWTRTQEVRIHLISCRAPS